MKSLQRAINQVEATFIEGPKKTVINFADQLFAMFEKGELSRTEYHEAVCNHLDSQAVPCTRPVRKSDMILVDPTTLKCLN